jgi:hypothetical protein
VTQEEADERAQPAAGERVDPALVQPGIHQFVHGQIVGRSRPADEWQERP